MASNVEYLRRVPLFKHVADNRLTMLAELVVRVQADPGDVIIREGEPGNSMFILLGGLVRIEKHSRPGERTVLAYRQAGDVIGELALIDESPRSAFAVAHTRVRMLRLTREEFRRYVLKDPELSFALLQSLAERLREGSTMIVDHRTKSVIDRVRNHLIGEADQHGNIRLSGSQSDWASLLGCSREALNRAVHQLIKSGLVEKLGPMEFRLCEM